MAAKMIPDMPKEFDPLSQEGLMFDELSNLSEDYYVFHSFSVVTVEGNTIRESETDFVIFHPKKGILCIEAKAGQVDYINGYWTYGSGRIMKKDGPYSQASSNKWKLRDYMLEHGLQYELDNCKLLHAVWFPDVPKSKFIGRSLPSNADMSITLTADSFGNIESEIDRLFSIDIPSKKQTNLSSKDCKRILERVLAPAFHLISLHELEIERNKNIFRKMLKEQVALLDYLDEQNNAIINGLAGTGKTVMAVEKARLHAEKGEEVLFLCYNVFLKDHLKETYPYPHVHYYTIDGLACKLCGTNTPDYSLLKDKLEDMFINSSFPYKHVIIDEGQDFGRVEDMEESIIDLLKTNAIDDEKRNGTFYLFYDKNQMINSKSVPSYIQDADCKLTLYRNCRNTENIALTSLRLLGSSKAPKLYKDAILGDIPMIGFASSKEEAISLLNSEIQKYVEAGYTSITILTCKTEETSIISEYCQDSKYRFKKGSIAFTTCRKFKGLESDVIIVIDIDRDTFDNDQGEQLMYVGTSRARFKLSCIMNLSEDECVELMDDRKVSYKRNVYKSFATALNAKVIQNGD